MPRPGDTAPSPAPKLATVGASIDEMHVGDASFRALASALPHMVWLTDPGRGVQYFSPRWEEFTGRPAAELVGAGYLELVHPDDRPALLQSADEFEEGGGAVEFRMLRHDGQYRWVEAFGAAVRDEHGRIVRVVGATHDISDRRHQEEATRELTVQLGAALALAHLGRYVYEMREPRKLLIDERLAEIFGVEGREFPASAFRAAIHEDDAPRFDRALAAAIESGSYELEYRIRRNGPGGPEVGWVAARGRIESDAAGPIRMIGVVEDITARKREAEMRATVQRREALGALVGGIAHDFNNLIGAIGSNAHLAALEVEQGSDPRESLGEIRRGLDVAAELVRRMLDYSRDTQSERAPLSLAAVVEDAVSLVRPALPAGARVAVRVPEVAPPLVLGDATQLHQVVVNLLTNAGQAIDGAGGAVTLEVGRTDDGERALLVVRDDGQGMEPAVARRAFEPFFTTKPPGSGTGLGLSAVRSIVRDHGGKVALDSTAGAGTTFTIELPLHRRDDAEPTAAGPLTDEPGTSETSVLHVMFVDDEQALARLAERALPLQGCATRAFTDPREALAVFIDAPGTIDVLVTDYSMPGLTGLELVDAMRTVRPDLPVILSSGYLTSADREAAAAQRVDAVLPKPCSIDEMVAAIRRIAVPAGE